jgi:SAM-dependent methyltransferase
MGRGVRRVVGDATAWPLWRLSALGERLGVSWMTYNPVVFRSFHELAVADAPGVSGAFEEVFPGVRRYADVGAGSGAFAAALRRRGHEVVACERGLAGRLLARRQGVDSRRFDLRRDPPAELGGAVDLAYCFEVAEHLDPGLGRRLVAFLAGLSPLVVFTAARPGQGGIGHVNEQPPEYWAAQFAEHGMKQREDLTDRLVRALRAAGVARPWFMEGLLVLERRGAG